MISSLSVFFPAVNEEDSIKNTVSKAVEVLDRLKIQYEIIIVDDGSTDKTGEIADEMARSNPKIRVIHHSKNLGYGSALKTGFKEAKLSWVTFNDSDGQFDFSEINLLLDKADEADVVLGYRLQRADSLLRKIYTFGWSMLANILLHLNVKDYSCGFKLIKKVVFEKVQPLEGEEKVTQIELLVKARRLGYKFAEVGVHHFPRKYGKPTGAKVSVVLKSLFDLFKLWWEIKEKKLAFFITVAILILAAVLRFYNLSGYMTFLGDEGRDAIIIKKILVEGDLPFIGPPTSVGNIYLGPLYYYMMAVPMSIFWLDPVAAAGMNALLGVATVALIYYLGKIWFGRMAGIASAFLYAISPVTIIYSRSSWNPNPAPFFALLSIWSIYRVHKSNHSRWLVLTGAFLAASMQMHYLATILLPIFGLLWVLELVKRIRDNRDIESFLLGTIGGVIAFWIVMMPLVLFDLKHNFVNYRAITAIFTNGQTVNFSLLETISRIPGIFVYNLVGRYMAGGNLILAAIVSGFVLLPLIIKRNLWTVRALFIWLVIGLLGLSFYKNDVYDHYLGFLNPVPFLLVGASISLLRTSKVVSKKVIYTICIALLSVIAFANLRINPLLNSPNNQLMRTQEVAKLIIEESKNEPFNFALISKNNYDSAYQFYLGLYGHKAMQIPVDVTGQLFVVCEEVVCDPVHSSKYEVVGFGWSKIDWMKEYFGVKVYRLVANPTGAP